MLIVKKFSKCRENGIDRLRNGQRVLQTEISFNNGHCYSIYNTDVLSYPAENATDENRQDLLSELNLMKNLEPHQNVIQLLGCVTKTGMMTFFSPCSC